MILPTVLPSTVPAPGFICKNDCIFHQALQSLHSSSRRGSVLPDGTRLSQNARIALIFSGVVLLVTMVVCTLAILLRARRRVRGSCDAESPPERYQKSKSYWGIAGVAHRWTTMKTIDNITIPISVETLAGSAVLSLDVKPSDTVDDVKGKIQDRTGIPPEEQDLTFSGNKLEGNHTISDYPIKQGSILHLICLIGHMEIRLKYLGGRSTTLQVESCDTINYLKFKIQDKLGIPQNQQALLFNGKRLKDDCLVSDYPIGRDSTLHMVIRLRGGPMVLFIEIAIGSPPIRLEIAWNDSIVNLKSKIQNLQGIPPDQQQFMFRGNQLEDNLRLTDFTDQVTLHATLRPTEDIQYIDIKEPTRTLKSYKCLLRSSEKSNIENGTMGVQGRSSGWITCLKSSWQRFLR